MLLNKFIKYTLCIFISICFLNNSYAALCITTQPTSKTCCTSGSIIFSLGVSGINHNFQWQYKNGTVWGNVIANSPIGATYLTPTNDTLTVSSITATGIYSYRCLVSGGGCTDTTVTVTLNVTVVPVAPAINPTLPNGTSVCLGATVSATISAGTGGAGNLTDTIQYSINGTNWLAYTSGTSITASTIGTSVLGFRTKRTATGSGCTTATNSTLYNVVAVPVAPTISATFTNGSTVCVGTTVSATFTAGTGGAGTTSDIFESTIDGTNWIAYSSGNNITAATTGNNVLGFRTRRTATGSGCSTSANNTTLYNVVAQPLAPTIIATLSNGTSVCVGATVSATFTTGTGGAGTTTDIFESTIDGTNWIAYTSGNNITATTTGNNVLGFRTRRTATGNGCTTSANNTTLYNVVAQPLAPTINTTLSNGTSVCVGATVSATFTAGTGGTGTTTDIFESTIDGTNWIAYSSGNNITAATTGNNVLGFRTRSTATGSGCATSANNTTLYNVVSVPIAQSINTALPNGTNICIGATASATFTGGSGGTGTITDIFEFTTNGSTWSAYTSGNTITASIVGNNVLGFRTRRTATGSGCTTSTNNTTLYNVVAAPVAQTISATYTDGSTVCVGTNVSAIFAGGSGGSGTINNIYESTIDGINWITYTPNSLLTADTIGTSVLGFRTKRTATGGGCSSSTYVTVLYNVVAAPNIILQPFNNIKCVGDSNTFTVAVNGGVSLSYQWQYFNGTTWNNVTNGSPIGALYNNQTSATLKVKGINNAGFYSYQCLVTSGGNGCTSPLISNTSNLTLNALPVPIITNNISICAGASASLAAGGGIGYVWTPATGLNSAYISNPTATPASTTSYSVTVTNTNGCSKSSNIVITVNPLPIANAGTDISVCSNDSTILNASGGLTYLWNPPTGLSSINIANPTAKPTSPTTYTVTVTDSNACVDIDTISVSISQPITAVISGNANVCKNSFWETYTANTNLNSYTWTVIGGNIMYGQNTYSIFVHWLNGSAGTVNLHETSNTSGCENSATLNVGINSNLAPDTVEIKLKSSDILICTDSTFTTYKWGYESKVTGTPIFTCNNTQYCHFSSFDPSNFYYWVIVGNGNGCETKSYYVTPNFNGIKNTEPNNKLKIYPNPANEIIKIDYELNAIYTDLKIEIYNVLGEKVHNQKLNNTNGSATINISAFPTGVYQINLSNQYQIIKSHKQIIVR